MELPLKNPDQDKDQEREQDQNMKFMVRVISR